MSHPLQQLSAPAVSWSWPITPAAYDRAPSSARANGQSWSASFASQAGRSVLPAGTSLNAWSVLLRRR